MIGAGGQMEVNMKTTNIGGLLGTGGPDWCRMCGADRAYPMELTHPDDDRDEPDARTVTFWYCDECA